MRQTFRIVGIVLAALVVIWLLAFAAQRALGATRTTKTFTPDRSKSVYGCGTGKVIVTEYGPLGDLFKTQWSEYFCFHNGIVYNAGKLRTKSWTTGLGQSLNWSYEDAGGDRNGEYINQHRAHKASARVHWKECVPQPLGCTPNQDIWWNGYMVVHNDGTLRFWRAS